MPIPVAAKGDKIAIASYVSTKFPAKLSSCRLDCFRIWEKYLREREITVGTPSDHLANILFATIIGLYYHFNFILRIVMAVNKFNNLRLIRQEIRQFLFEMLRLFRDFLHHV